MILHITLSLVRLSLTLFKLCVEAVNRLWSRGKLTQDRRLGGLTAVIKPNDVLSSVENGVKSNIRLMSTIFNASWEKIKIFNLCITLIISNPSSIIRRRCNKPIPISPFHDLNLTIYNIAEVVHANQRCVTPVHPPPSTWFSPSLSPVTPCYGTPSPNTWNVRGRTPLPVCLHTRRPWRKSRLTNPRIHRRHIAQRNVT